MSALAEQIIQAATQAGLTVATAESCTGGLIAAALTDVAGSSAVFDRGFVTYSNEAKAEMLDVPLSLTVDPGAVSHDVAKLMAEGAIEKAGVDCSVAVTGIAGPGGGSAAKPVGLVFIAVASRNLATTVRECRFGESHGASERGKIRNLTVQVALELLLERIAQESAGPPSP